MDLALLQSIIKSSPAEYLGLFGFNIELIERPAAANEPKDFPPIISKIDEILRPV